MIREILCPLIPEWSISKPSSEIEKAPGISWIRTRDSCFKTGDVTTEPQMLEYIIAMFITNTLNIYLGVFLIESLVKWFENYFKMLQIPNPSTFLRKSFQIITTMVCGILAEWKVNWKDLLALLICLLII